MSGDRGSQRRKERSAARRESFRRSCREVPAEVAVAAGRMVLPGRECPVGRLDVGRRFRVPDGRFEGVVTGQGPSSTTIRVVTPGYSLFGTDNPKEGYISALSVVVAL